MNKFELYIADIESTGLDPEKNDIIELSIYRMSDDVQKTWFVKPMNFDTIQQDALRVNGHKLEDLKQLTPYGKTSYQDPSKVVAEIENWLMEDLRPSDERILTGQNVHFDKTFLMHLWKKCNAEETFPFSKRFIIDTMQIQLFLEVAGKSDPSEYYNLSSLVEKYGVKKERFHSAASDTRMTKDVFLKQMELIK